MKITAIIGTYRRGGVIDSAVDEILASAQQEGAQVEKIYLIDRRIEFCTNCRTCTQQPGAVRGQCALQDEMPAILDTIQQSDAIILASPMNFWNVTAVTKRFIERLVCFAYWPWDAGAPKTRQKPDRNKRAVVVASSAAPAFLVRLFTKMVGGMKAVVRLLGFGNVDVLLVGLAAMKPDQPLTNRAKQKARRLGKKLARPK